MEQGKLWSRNEAQVWGTFEVYPLEESYRHQLARHLCEINNYSYKNVDPNLPSSSQRPKESYPTDRIIPQNTDDGQIRTEFYVPEPECHSGEAELSKPCCAKPRSSSILKNVDLG